MFCPKCASQNTDGASFCRVCGANISLVPHALTGQLPVEQEEAEMSRAEKRSTKRHKRESSLEGAFRNAFMGIGFLFVAIALSFSIGRGWWFWMLIPAFSMMGTGVAQYIRHKEQEKKAMLNPPPPTDAFQPRVTAFTPRRQTGELMPPPPSVTEGTTRHLGAEGPTRHLDASKEVQK